MTLETSCFFPDTLWCPDFLTALSDLRWSFVTISFGSSEISVRVSCFLFLSFFSFLFSLAQVSDSILTRCKDPSGDHGCCMRTASA